MNTSLIRHCSFFGHRDIENTESLRVSLKNYIEWLIINRNVGIFLFGGFGDFDDLCYEVVSELKIKFPFIQRTYCLEDERYLEIRKRPKYLKKEKYEEFVYYTPEFDWWYTRIYYRNCEMIKRSDFVIFYVNTSENSGAFNAYKYAKKNKKDFVNFGKIK